MYIYLLSSTVYMLCFVWTFFFFFTIMHWSCKTKMKKPQAGEFVILNFLR